MYWLASLKTPKTLKTGFGLFFFAPETPVNTGV